MRSTQLKSAVKSTIKLTKQRLKKSSAKSANITQFEPINVRIKASQKLSHPGFNITGNPTLFKPMQQILSIFSLIPGYLVALAILLVILPTIFAILLRYCLYRPLQGISVAFTTSLIAIACSSLLTVLNLLWNTNIVKASLFSFVESSRVSC